MLKNSTRHILINSSKFIKPTRTYFDFLWKPVDLYSVNAFVTPHIEFFKYLTAEQGFDWVSAVF